LPKVTYANATLSPENYKGVAQFCKSLDFFHAVFLMSSTSVFEVFTLQYFSFASPP